MSTYKAPPAVTVGQVAAARQMMREGKSMTESAIALRVRSCDLDQALWACIGTDLDHLLGFVQRPEPMF